MTFIDHYCESSAHGFWNEPLNAWTNLAFILAALVAARALHNRGAVRLVEWGLVLLAGLIGVGSFAFHTDASTATEWADVIPIWSFVALYVLTAIYRATGEDPRRTLRIGLIAAIITGAILYLTSGDLITDSAEGATTALNGSMQYAPALAALVVFALITQLHRHPIRWYVLGAALAFLASLCFRSMDLASCAATGGIGTHFMWHLLNGTMIGLLLLGLIRKLPPRSQP